jgi:hypothetical protein
MIINYTHWCLFKSATISGLTNEPKYTHLRDLHKAIKQCESALVSVDPTVSWPGKNLEVNSIMR